MDIIHRTAATEVTLTHYIDASFAWGSRDCVRMCAFHVKKMGHKVSLVKAGSYSSERGAWKALERAGFATVEEALDARFSRIIPAMAMVGDILAMESDRAFPALAIRLSNGRALCTLNGGFAIVQPLHLTAAWRVPYLGAL